jgi:3-phenylpropionate/trans-cinnamate dioxygenase ferredoxin reductase subunit
VVHYKYLIIGGGMTADSAVRGIRELDEDGKIGLIGKDPNPPYNRPPLSKGLWKGKPLNSVFRQTEQFSLDLYLGKTAQSIDPERQIVRDDQGSEFGYDKLLLATGGTPRRFPFDVEDIIYYRTLTDYHLLHDLSSQADHFAVIGGGFIGSEVSAALAMNGKKVTLLFPQAGIGAHLYPAELSNYLNDFYRQKGIELIPEVRVTEIHKRNGSYHITTDKGQKITAAGVVAGLGIQPNVDLAQSAGLKLGNGIVVDDTLHTSDPHIFAAGDVAEFYNPALGKRVRIEHEDNANTMGQQAGRNMAGANQPYHHLPYFYSDLFELGYEAVGELNPQFETVLDWKDPFKKGVVYYCSQGRVRGVLLWNVWDSVPKARQLIAETGPFTAGDLMGRL